MEMPEELESVLGQNADAKAKFDAYPPSHQREDTNYVNEAKQPETRQRRAEKVIGMIKEK